MSASCFECEGETRMIENGGNRPIMPKATARLKKQWKYQIGYGMAGGE